MENFNFSFKSIESGRANLEQTTKIGLAVVCLLSLFCGLMMKSIVFWHLSQTKIWSKPINVLILVDELIFVITGSYVLIQMSLWLFTATNAFALFESLFGIQVNSHRYCSFYLSVASFHYFYGSLGSFGISVHRFVFILSPNWVKKLIQEEHLLIFILSLCLFTNFGLVILYTTGNATKRTGFNTCMGRTETFQVNLGNLESRHILLFRKLLLS